MVSGYHKLADAFMVLRRPPRPSSPTKVPGPKYDLDVVRGVFRLAVLGKTRAIHCVMRRVGVGEPEAEQFIQKALNDLQKNSYESSVQMDEWDDDDATVIADVYGITDDHGGWYIKFYVEHGRVQLVSFHEPDFDMTCVDGTKVKGRSHDC